MVLIDPTELKEAKVEFFVKPLFKAPDIPGLTDDSSRADCWLLELNVFVSNFEDSNFEFEFEFALRTGFDGQSEGSNVSLKINMSLGGLCY